MLNLGIGEVSTIIVIAAMVFGVDEFKSTYRWLRAAQSKFFNFKQKVYNQLDEAEKLAEDQIIDLEGNLQKRYSVDQLDKLIDDNDPKSTNE